MEENFIFMHGLIDLLTENNQKDHVHIITFLINTLLDNF